MVIEFPARAFGYGCQVAIRLPQSEGVNSRLWLRNIAKAEMSAQYFLAIQTGISGESDGGQKIQIDNLGKWLFGTPGYKGHLRTLLKEDNPEVMVQIPESSPLAAKEFLLELKKLVESK